MVPRVSMARASPVVTSVLPPLPKVPATGANPPPTGTPGDAIRTTRRMSPTIRCRPRPTPLSLTMSGTTRTTTSGELRLGVRTETSMALPPTARPHLLRTGVVLAELARPDTAARSARAMAASAHTVVLEPLVVLATRTGRVPPTPTRPLAVPTITTSGPSRLTAPITTQDGANPTTLSQPSLTTTRATPEPSRPMMTSGLRTTTDTMPVMPPPAVPPPPGGARRPTPSSAAFMATVATPSVSTRAPYTMPLPAPTPPRPVASPVPTGMPGAETKT